METYTTHDNGGRPFRVTIDGDTVRVYASEEHDVYFPEPSLIVNAKRVFVGRSPLNNMTEYSGGHGPEFDGNTILVQLHLPLTYLFIGNDIFTFHANAEITEYTSPIGNNDVPYPYAKDELDNIYLLTENAVMSGKKNHYEGDDPYSHYYEVYLITPANHFVPATQPIHPHFRDIKKYKIGKETYCMHYVPDAGEDYDRIMDWEEGDMNLVFMDGTKQVLTRDDYIDIMDDFGKYAGLVPLHPTMICGRGSTEFAIANLN